MESFLVTAFNFQKSIQNLIVPSFFLTNTAGDIYGLLDSFITH